MSTANATTAFSNGTTENATVELLNNLIPALLKTFLVILAGYIFGVTNLYPKQHASAIGKLCGTLLLPVAMLDAMATLVVTDEAWHFLYAVAICKGAIFFIVLGVVIGVGRTKDKIGRAAVWAVFSTQSNDFALGLPIFNVSCCFEWALCARQAPRLLFATLLICFSAAAVMRCTHTTNPAPTTDYQRCAH